MNHQPRFWLFLGLVLGSLFALPARAQLGFDLDIKKPEPYDNRETKAEKTPDKPIKIHKRALQNMVTHYNYFYNANAKINEVLDGAKQSHKDLYTRLLPFYPYTLDATAGQAQQLDSVVLKAKAGIVLHDLRNDWIDNLYLLWGAAYYFEKKFDSAYTMFQFINWAFADKEKDGYYRYIGSRIDGNAANQIASQEKKPTLVRRALTEPPSRNDALVWQVRTLIQQEAYPEAGSLLSALVSDPAFPARLRPQLEEVQAYLYYQQKAWDSSAIHLVKALPAAGTRQEKARWEYLAAQMFERKGRIEDAKTWYAKAIDHSDDPVMEVYARLNLIRINKEGGDNYIDRNIATLLKMARKDKYEEYRDVIYSMLAQMEIERGNFLMAQEYLRRSAKFRSESPNQTANNEAYLALADRSFDQRLYKTAAQFYDSVKPEGLTADDSLRINERKPLLTQLVAYTNTLERQDSLLRLAALSEDERKDFVRRISRQLRRAQGLKEEAAAAPRGGNAGGTTPDPFTTGGTGGTGGNRGEWYFYNDNARRNGAASFRQIWGDRPNVDNWRRATDVTTQLRKTVPEATRNVAGTAGPRQFDDPLSFEALMDAVPLTPEAQKIANDSIQYALRGLGLLYSNEMGDYAATIETLEGLRKRYPAPDSLDAVLFNLYFAYQHTGNTAKAEEMKRLLQSRFPQGRYTAIATTGQDPAATNKVQAAAATRAYENVYDLYLSGRFVEAEAAKVVADSMYRTNKWEPQLLYIQAVAQVKQQQDSAATRTLNTLVAQAPNTPLAEKATTLLRVLGRRAQIEEELRNLQVERPVEDSVAVVPPPQVVTTTPTPVVPPVVRDTVAAPPAPRSVQTQTSVTGRPRDTASVSNKPVAGKPRIDTSSRTRPAVPVTTPGSPYRFYGDSAQFAVIVMQKVDIVYVNEARNAFARYNAGKGRTQEASVVPVNNDVKLLLVGPFATAADAIGYVQEVKPITPTQILPWLKGGNYSYSIISPFNLQVVQAAKEMEAYQKFLDSRLPVKL
ncbi:hypothetical protein [Flaviaesturariibacter amylovorans]|uniref:Tetratricopeptide repeat protein n=1 Tax=Flaviaesturariibacter amylovorans TaxID=1084520 RepID=A0ABP8GLM7_9BACT